MKISSFIARTTMIILMTAGGLSLPAADNDRGYKRNATPPTDGRVGSSYTPAYASNPIQFWYDFRPEVVKMELAATSKHFGISMLRVYVNYTNYSEDRENFFKNLDTFIGIAEKAGIKPGFVFFSGDHRAFEIDKEKSSKKKQVMKVTTINLTGPHQPKAGHHNGRWPSCPQEHQWDKENPENFGKFKPYIQDIIGKYKTDKRVLFWEIHNEPPHGDKRRDALKTVGYKWAKELKPIQPVMNCEFNGGWGDSDVTDIISSHMYNCVWPIWNKFADDGLKEGNYKGTMFTEAGARWKASRRNHAGPTDVMHWLKNQRKKQNKPVPGVMLVWELNVGNSNCRWHWVENGWKIGKPDAEPEIPWCGLQWPNGEPVSLAEAEVIRKHATGKNEALLYDDFQEGTKQWKFYGTKGARAHHALYLNHGWKAIAGDAKWTDYTVEARVLYKRKWLRRNEKRNDYSAVEGKPSAGVYFRVNKPGDKFKDINAYYAYHDTENLVLGKYTNGKWKELASYDLKANKVQARPMEWSMIRVEAIGPRIKVFLNRYHGDKDKGLRIDFTDKNEPILSGSIGLGSFKVDGLFDNVVVLPIKK
jgi:hypothetical protein